MLVLLFSDLHAHAFQAYSKMLPNGRNSRLQVALDVLEEITSICNKCNVDGVLFGGDMFHIRPGLGSMKIPTFNAVYAAIAKLKIGRQFVGVLVGNHDQGNRTGTEHSVYAFKSIVTVMDERGWYTFSSYNEQICVYAVPATSDVSSLKIDLEEAHSKLCPGPEVVGKIMLGHLGIDGAEIGTNFRMKDDRLLSVGDFPKEFDWVFLGDYHKPQQLASNVYYIGATHQHNWGDSGQHRRVLLWDTESGELFSEPIRSAPLFVKLDRANLGSIAPSEVEGNWVRVYYQKQLSVAMQNAIIEDLTNLGALHVECVREESSSTSTADEVSTFSPTMDQETMIDAYVSTQDSDIDPSLLRRVGHEIFNKAMGNAE